MTDAHPRGLAPAHSDPHLTRAVLEGISFAMRDPLSILQEPGSGALREPAAI